MPTVCLFAYLGRGARGEESYNYWFNYRTIQIGHSQIKYLNQLVFFLKEIENEVVEEVVLNVFALHTC